MLCIIGKLYKMYLGTTAAVLSHEGCTCTTWSPEGSVFSCGHLLWDPGLSAQPSSWYAAGRNEPRRFSTGWSAGTQYMYWDIYIFFLHNFFPLSVMSYSKMLDACHVGNFILCVCACVFRLSLQTMHVCWCLYSWKPLCGVSSQERKHCSHTRCTGWSDGSIWNIFPEDAVTGTGDHTQISKKIYKISCQLV